MLRLAIGGREIDAGGFSARARFQVREFIDQLVRLIDARFGFGRAGLGAAPEPLEFILDSIRERFLAVPLRLKVSLPVL